MPEDYEQLDSRIASLSSDIESDGPYIVHGVAIGAGDITHGGSGKKTLWPKEVLKEAAEGLEGQPLATDQDHTADDPKPQTPVEAIAGEVTWAGYGEVDGKEGVLYEAELDDKDLAKKVQNERIDVSPLVARDLEPLEDHEEADYKATEIQAWRDLALVSSGASPSNSISSGANPVQATALHEAVEAARGESAAPEGEDNEGSDDGTQTTDPQSSLGQESPDTTDADDKDTMSDETPSLSESEKAILSAADGVEEPVEALNEYAAAEDAQIVEQAEYESLTEQVETAKDLYADALSERWETDKDKIKSNFGLEALREEFETEDGELDKEALVQNPQTGQPTPDEEENESGHEALSDDADVEYAEALYRDYQSMNLGGDGLKNDIVDALGVDDFETAEEVLD